MDLTLLKKVPLFGGLTNSQLQKVAQIAERRRFEGSEFIFKERDAGDAMYIVAEGKVRISKTVPGIGEEALAILEVGQYFGEMSLIEDDSLRSADAIAHIPCEVWVLERAKLEHLMFTDKDLAYVMLWTFVRTLSSRLRETSDKIKAFFAISRF